MLTRLCDRLSRLLHLPRDARGLAKLGLILWVISLCLPGLVDYGKPEVLFGYFILIWGWLMPGPWYANPFLIFALLALRRPGRVPLVSTFLATAIAGTVVTVDKVYFDQGGARDLYGFGWGAAVWLAAIAVTIIGVGRRIAENRNAETREYETSGSVRLSGTWWRNLGVLLLSFIAFGGSAWAAWNFLWADRAEYPNLFYAPFKRGAVWHVGMPAPAERMDLNGPLAVRFDRETMYTLPDKLLAWGVPTVRMNGLDYGLSYPAGQRVLSASPAKGDPGAVLVLGGSAHAGYTLSLTGADPARRLVEHQWQADQHWETVAGWPADIQPVHAVVADALNIRPSGPERLRLQPARITPQQPRLSNAAVTGATGGGQYTCPPGVQLQATWRRDPGSPRETHPEWGWSRHVLTVGERFYFGLAGSGVARISCQDGAVYILDDHVIEKRALDDFRLFWVLRIDHATLPQVARGEAIAAWESSDALFVDYRGDQDGKRHLAELGLPQSMPGTGYAVSFTPATLPVEHGRAAP